jgi:hypothetical protein
MHKYHHERHATEQRDDSHAKQQQARAGAGLSLSESRCELAQIYRPTSGGVHLLKQGREVFLLKVRTVGRDHPLATAGGSALEAVERSPPGGTRGEFTSATGT